MKKEIAWWSVQALIVCVGLVFMVTAFVGDARGLLHEVSLALGATLMSVGAVALVYEVIGRARMQHAFETMLTRYLGVQSAEAEGISRVTCDFAHLPWILDDSKCPTHLLLVGLDCHRFMITHNSFIRKALLGSNSRRKRFTLSLLFQDPESHFAEAIRDLQGPPRIDQMRVNQDAWLSTLTKLIQEHSHVAQAVRVRFSSTPILGGLAIATDYRGGFPDTATYSPYLRVAPDETTPSLCIRGPDSHLFKIMKEHFRALWETATVHPLPGQEEIDLVGDPNWLPR